MQTTKIINFIKLNNCKNYQINNYTRSYFTEVKKIQNEESSSSAVRSKRYRREFEKIFTKNKCNAILLNKFNIIDSEHNTIKRNLHVVPGNTLLSQTMLLQQPQLNTDTNKNEEEANINKKETNINKNLEFQTLKNKNETTTNETITNEEETKKNRKEIISIITKLLMIGLLLIMMLGEDSVFIFGIIAILIILGSIF